MTSWRDGPTKVAITDFVARVTEEGGKDFVPPEERIAVFDNDGTLWTEHPLVIQLDFTIRRLGALAEEKPELRAQQPYRAAYEKDLAWMGAAMVKHYQGDDADLGLLMKAVPAAFESVTVEEYDRNVRDFFADAANQHLKRPYVTCGYLPMIELLRYLEANGFTNYIASGGDRDFMRPIAGTMYGIPPERVIGSALGISFDDNEGRNDLMYKGQMDFFDDGPEKPIRIWSRIGRRPIVAFGNSNGDIPMLSFAGGPEKPALRLLLKHDDAEREFDYVKGAERALDVAAGQGWTVVSIADDWSSVFADPQ
jgi:phosphoglycolate phosphatase-like HAD superfamily hydrolase